MAEIMTTKPVRNIKLSVGKDGRTRVVTTLGKVSVSRRIAAAKSKKIKVGKRP